jgi:pre-mRNA-processing factor 19
VVANRSVRPRPIAATSIPNILALFQVSSTKRLFSIYLRCFIFIFKNEWDELMLETYTLRQSLDSTRQELSQALYQHDAACRVIATLMRERDEARASLSNLQTQFKHGGVANGQSVPMEISDAAPSQAAPVKASGTSAPNGSGLGGDALQAITDKCVELSAKRKERKVSSSLASKEALSGYSQKSTHSVHKSDKPGVTSVSIRQQNENLLLLSGGVDKQVILTDNSDGKVVARVTGHSKKINAVSFSPDLSQNVFFSASADGTVKVLTMPRVFQRIFFHLYPLLLSYRRGKKQARPVGALRPNIAKSRRSAPTETQRFQLFQFILLV